ncbi:MAG TPA: hypothetical protein VFU43_30110 [Streptosporangiaceae bacterium]|nr:hypothetical protein [Streptosporangiaceae bacterium]
MPDPDFFDRLIARAVPGAGIGAARDAAGAAEAGVVRARPRLPGPFERPGPASGFGLADEDAERLWARDRPWARPGPYPGEGETERRPLSTGGPDASRAAEPSTLPFGRGRDRGVAAPAPPRRGTWPEPEPARAAEQASSRVVRELLGERPILVPGAPAPAPGGGPVPPRPAFTPEDVSRASPGPRPAAAEPPARPRPAERAEAAAAPPPFQQRRRPPTEKVVHVHIGRLEVSAGTATSTSSSAAAPRRRPERPAPAVTLERFLGRPS